MNDLTRFGKRPSFPSTAEIKYHLRLMMAADALRETISVCLSDFGNARIEISTSDLAREHGLAVDRAQMLIDHLGLGDASLTQKAFSTAD